MLRVTMQTLIPCFSCRSLVPSDHDACPVCGAAKRSWLRNTGLLVAAGAVAVTLMACYGPPPCAANQQPQTGCFVEDAGTDAGQ